MRCRGSDDNCHFQTVFSPRIFSLFKFGLVCGMNPIGGQTKLKVLGLTTTERGGRHIDHFWKGKERNKWRKNILKNVKNNYETKVLILG